MQNKLLQRMKAKNKDLIPAIDRKIAHNNERLANILNPLKAQGFKDEMEGKVRDILGRMNKELELHNAEESEELFLVGNRYTLADVYLTIFLTRLKMLDYYEVVEQYELLDKYYKQMRARWSFSRGVLAENIAQEFYD